MRDSVEIRDKRRPGFFMVDNHVLDLYARKVGVTAWAVYTVICRSCWSTSKKTQTSVSMMAELLGLSRPTVKRATRKLETYSLIRRKKTQSVSIIELLEVEQLDFKEKLILGGITSEPTEQKPQGSPVSPRKDHQRALGGITSEPLLKTRKTVKTSIPIKEEIDVLKKRGIEVMRTKGPKAPELAQLSTQIEKLRKKAAVQGGPRA